MNTSLTAYTPLESLLLFQSLASYGVEPSIFSRISELLKKNPHISSAERFESGRLSPDALRNFYLQILKEEIKGEAQDGTQNGEAQNGELKNSRKRKAPSPALSTVQEAAQHSYLIPRLVAKLYRRYRSSVTEQIREDERRYHRLHKELQEIERGEWDHKFRVQEKVNGKSPIPQAQPSSKPSPAPQPAQTQPVPQTTVPDGHIGVPVPAPALNRLAPEGHQHDQVHPALTQKSPEPLNKLPTPNERPPSGFPPPISSPRKTAPSPVPPPLQSQLPSPHLIRGPQQLPPPRLPPPQAPSQGQNGSPTLTHRSPYPPHGQHLPGPAQSHITQAPPATTNVTIHPHPAQAVPPSILPPPPGAHFPPCQPMPPYTGNGVPQYAHPQPPIPFSPNPQFSGPYPHGPLSPGVQTSQPPRYPPYHGPPAPYAQQPPSHPPITQPPHQGGIMLPPFHVAPQEPSQAQSHPQHPPHPPPQQQPQHAGPPHQQRPHLQQRQSSHLPPQPHQPPVPSRFPHTQAEPLTPRPPQTSLPPVGIHPAPSQMTPSNVPLSLPRIRGPFSTPQPLRNPVAARSAKTLWKTIAKIPAGTPIKSPPVSPIEEKAPFFEEARQVETSAKAPKKSKPKPKGKGKASEIATDKESPAEPGKNDEIIVETEGRPSRSGRKQPQVLGGRSVASPQLPEPTQGQSPSQSFGSHAGTPSIDNESAAGFDLKTEPSITAETIEEDTVSTPSHGAALRRQANAAQVHPGAKRKRALRAASIAESEATPSPEVPQTIVAPRHFSRMCVPIMNDIGSHKHASTFIAPVKPKDAEGYYDIIKRPTDLKTIQKAITAGAKVVGLAASAADTPSGSPGGGGGNVVLPLSADVVPPKAIVNSAQLEKELMRMFVNAVMFNAGEEGIVEDTREMFETVQQSVSNWRSAERSTGGLENEEAPGADDDGPATSKRRKM